jgi:hypothetical protein
VLTATAPHSRRRRQLRSLGRPARAFPVHASTTGQPGPSDLSGQPASEQCGPSALRAIGATAHRFGHAQRHGRGSVSQQRGIDPACFPSPETSCPSHNASGILALVDGHASTGDDPRRRTRAASAKLSRSQACSKAPQGTVTVTGHPANETYWHRWPTGEAASVHVRNGTGRCSGFSKRRTRRRRHRSTGVTRCRVEH